MPYIPHWRATTHFNLGPTASPKEEATCTLNFQTGVGDIWNDRAQVVANDMYEDWASWVTSAAGRVSSHVTLNGLKLYSVGADGRIDQDPVEADGPPTAGAFPDNLHPWQCTIVATLVAGARGKGRFGRIYLPPQSYTVTNNGTILESHMTDIYASVLDLLTNLSNAPTIDTGFGLVVAGKTGAGTLREVDSIKMGHVVDTQRRRRRSIDENYLVGAFEA